MTSFTHKKRFRWVLRRPMRGFRKALCIGATMAGVLVSLTVPPANASQSDSSRSGAATSRAGGAVFLCNTAGPGVSVGTGITFTLSEPFDGAGNGTISSVVIPAGPEPGGYCKDLGMPTISTKQVVIAESVPVGNEITEITMSPAQKGASCTAGEPGSQCQLSITLRLPKAQQAINVNFTNAATALETGGGWLDLCEQNGPSGDQYQFVVNGETLVVPEGTCIGPLLVPSGPVTVAEPPPSDGLPFAGSCATIPASALQSCVRDSNDIGGVAVAAIFGPNSAGTRNTTILTVDNGKATPIAAASTAVVLCNTAGPGVPIGTQTSFSFSPAFLSGGTPVSSVTIPAGPAPEGYCKVLGQPSLTKGKQIITESVPTGEEITEITAPPSVRVSYPKTKGSLDAPRAKPTCCISSIALRV